MLWCYDRKLCSFLVLSYANQLLSLSLHFCTDMNHAIWFSGTLHAQLVHFLKSWQLFFFSPVIHFSNKNPRNNTASFLGIYCFFKPLFPEHDNTSDLKTAPWVWNFGVTIFKIMFIFFPLMVAISISLHHSVCLMAPRTVRCTKQPICPWICPAVCLSVWFATGMSVFPYMSHASFIKLHKWRPGAGCSVKVEAIDTERHCSVFNDPL